MFQYSREQLVGQDVEVLMPERLRDAHVRDRQSYVIDPQPRPMGTGRELKALRKDGHEFTVEVGLSPLTTSAGIFIVTTIVDISERKHAEDLFQQLFQFSPDGTVVAAKTAVFADIDPGAFVAGTPAVDHRSWKRSRVLLKRLPELRKELTELRRRVEELEALGKRSTEED